MFQVQIQHQGLHAYRVVKGMTASEAEYKAALQLQKWEEQWSRVVLSRQREQDKNRTFMLKEQAKALAVKQDADAEAFLASLDTLLRDSVTRDHRVIWEKLKLALRYSVQAPPPPTPAVVPPAPTKQTPTPELGILARLIPSLRLKKEAEARTREEQRYSSAYSTWEGQKNSIDAHNRSLLEQHEAELKKHQADRQSFIEQAEAHNEAVELQREAYLRKEPAAIVDVCHMVLDDSTYPDSFPSDVDIDYIVENRTLVVEYALPAVEALPTIRGYKYVAAKNEIQPLLVSDAWLNRTYDSVLYQVTLRVLYELAQADEANALDAIVFNGWVNSIDKATGKEVNACIVTVQALKAELLEINMEQVDPKACFKKLKGVAASKLVNLSPVRPILQLNKSDSRFVPSHNVVDGLDESANLAAMDWEEFEHLIREVFEKEFSANGGEVKITQASRDGGVDAVVFDPDPIRGGKIVIQAKRYTNTVSVSAVRDLYGTLMNEGANKGILVSTADYGPDAYEFSKGKPITLLNGSELLYLLQKQGHKARINLTEARLLAAEREKTAGIKTSG